MNRVLVDRKADTVRLTLNRPDRGNAIDLPLARELLSAAIACDSDSSVRCVAITGAGRMFCAGGDVAGFAEAGADVSAYLFELAGTMHSALLRFAGMNKPLVTIVNGPAAGAGFALALAGDIVLCSRNAHFTAAYTSIGLTPDSGLTWILPRVVGLRSAQDLLLTNRRIDAGEALALGIATRTVDPDRLTAEGEDLTAELAGQATDALGATRKLLQQSFTSEYAGQMEREAQSIASVATGVEAREGIAAFLAKRRPDFRRS